MGSGRDFIQGFNPCHEKWTSILQLREQLQGIDKYTNFLFYQRTTVFIFSIFFVFIE